MSWCDFGDSNSESLLVDQESESRKIESIEKVKETREVRVRAGSCHRVDPSD